MGLLVLRKYAYAPIKHSPPPHRSAFPLGPKVLPPTGTGTELNVSVGGGFTMRVIKMNDLLLLSKPTVIIKPFIIMGKVRRTGGCTQTHTHTHTRSAGAQGILNSIFISHI